MGGSSRCAAVVYCAVVEWMGRPSGGREDGSRRCLVEGLGCPPRQAMTGVEREPCL